MIVSTIQSVVSGLSQPVGFHYANLYEANVDLDKYDQPQEIIFLYLPPFSNTDTVAENGLLHTVFPLEFYLLKRINKPTTDYKSIDVQPVIDELRELAREFIHDLNHEDVVETGGPAAGITNITYESIYGNFDSNLFGVRVTCDVPIMEGKTGCVP